MIAFAPPSFAAQRAAGDRSPRRPHPLRFESRPPAPDPTKRATYESSNPFPKTRLGDVVVSGAGRYQRRTTRTYDGTFDTLLVDIGEGRERLFAVGTHDIHAAKRAARAPINESRAKGGIGETAPVIRRVLANRGLVGSAEMQTAIVAFGRYVVAQGLKLRTATDPAAFRADLEELQGRIILQDWAGLQRAFEEEAIDV